MKYLRLHKFHNIRTIEIKHDQVLIPVFIYKSNS